MEADWVSDRIMTKYFVFRAADLFGQERRDAVNFALRVARDGRVCKETAIKSDGASLKLYDRPTGEFAERLKELGFKEEC